MWARRGWGNPRFGFCRGMHFFFFLSPQQQPSAAVKQVEKQQGKIAVRVYLITCASVLHAGASSRSCNLSSETPPISSSHSLTRAIQKIRHQVDQQFFGPRSLSHLLVVTCFCPCRNDTGKNIDSSTPRSTTWTSLSKWFRTLWGLSRLNDSWSELPLYRLPHPPGNKRIPFYFIPIQDWTLMIAHRTKPPAGPEMEIWEDTNAIREIYGGHLKLMDIFRLYVGASSASAC